MTAARRAFLGAALGAFLTILVHPLSRPFLIGNLGQPGPSALAAQLYLRSRKLPPPVSLQDSALWLRMAADRIVDLRPLKRSEVESVLKIARDAEAKDNDNAFWPQMRAVLLRSIGKNDEAIDAWRRAARRRTWNDYQSDNLLQSRERIASLVGMRQSWQTSYVYYGRSANGALLIERFARGIISNLDLNSSQSLELRTITLRNGSLLRDTARSVEVGAHGANIVDLASYPGRLSSIRSPKKLLLAQIAMFNALREEGRQPEADMVYDSFRQNDGWRAMTTREDYEAESDDDALQSVLVSTLPGSLALCGAVGFLIWVLGMLIGQRGGHRFRTPVVIGSSLVLGAVAYALSGNVFAAITMGLCAVFLVYGPERGRKRRDDYVGPLFTFMVGLLSVAFFVSFVLFVAGASLPSMAVLPLTGIPADFYGGRSMFIGLSSIMLGLVLLTAPAWSLVQHRTTPQMLSLALRRFGGNLAVGCLLLTIVATPLCVHRDRSLDHDLTQMVGNEPVYHLIQ